MVTLSSRFSIASYTLVLAMALILPMSLKAESQTGRISLDDLHEYFELLGADPGWTASKPVRWGYYFRHRSPGALQTASEELATRGYHIVSIFPGESNDPPTPGRWWLLAERVDQHSPESLFQMVQSLYRFADDAGLDAFEGPRIDWLRRPVMDPADSPEHAVLVHFRYGGSDRAPIYELEDKLESAIAAAGVGEFDGNEIALGDDDSTLFMYGPSAEALFDVVRPVLEAAPFLRGARVTLRFGASDGATPKRTLILPK